MKDLMRSILLSVAIYSGAFATANSHGYAPIIGALVCGLACSVFVAIKDNKKD